MQVNPQKIQKLAETLIDIMVDDDDMVADVHEAALEAIGCETFEEAEAMELSQHRDVLGEARSIIFKALLEEAAKKF